MAKNKSNQAPAPKNGDQKKSDVKKSAGGKEISSGKVNFIGAAKPFGIFSVVMIIASLAVIFTKGLNYGIDFAGGTEVQVQFNEQMESSKIGEFVQSLGVASPLVQSFGEKNEYLLRFETAQGKDDKETNEKNNELIQKVTGGITTNFSTQGASIRRVDSVGPQIGDELKRNGLLAIFYSLLMILIYVGLRFDYQYAPGAVVALAHDSIITLGIFALLQKEVNVQILAAVLTIIGYSLNDTIVNFDRIRETRGLFRGQALSWMINRSINDMLTRTVLTSVTTLLAVSSLYFIAGGVIEDFAFALGIGVIVGTYSSIYVASPMLLLFDKAAKSA